MRGLYKALSLLTLLATAALPAGAAGSEGDASAAGAAASDWNWDSFTGLDDAPVTGTATEPATKPVEAPTVPGSAENAFPDFDAPVRQAYAVFKDVPPFEVIPSQRDADMHPCANCHQWVASDPTPRKLRQPHDNFALEHGLHGKGKFWCFTCHDLEGSGGLKTLEGEKVDFADAYILCSQCHSDQARDWVYGAHGKRVSGWQDTRRVLNCTACHYQHKPRFKPREPKPGPVVRMQLDRPAHWTGRDGSRPGTHGYENVWTDTDHEDGADGAVRHSAPPEQNAGEGKEETDARS